MFVIVSEYPAGKINPAKELINLFRRKKYISLQSCGVDGAEFFIVRIPHFFEEPSEKVYRRMKKALSEGRRLGQSLLLPPEDPGWVGLAAELGYRLYHPLQYKKRLAVVALERIAFALRDKEVPVLVFDPEGDLGDPSFFVKLADITHSITVYTERERTSFYDRLMAEYGIPVICTSDPDVLQRGGVILAFSGLFGAQREISLRSVIFNLCPGPCCDTLGPVVINDYFFNIPSHVSANIPPGIRRVDYLGALFELGRVEDVKFYRMTAFCAGNKPLLPDQICRILST